MARIMLIALALAGGVLPAAAPAEPDTCRTLRAPVTAGEFITAEEVADTACREEQLKLPLRYDRAARAPVATRTIPAGTYLGRLTLTSGAIAAPGETLQLVIHDGPVTILRAVEPVQPLRAGRRGFVRTEDGQVLTARFVPLEAPR